MLPNLSDVERKFVAVIGMTFGKCC